MSTLKRGVYWGEMMGVDTKLIVYTFFQKMIEPRFGFYTYLENKPICVLPFPTVIGFWFGK